MKNISGILAGIFILFIFLLSSKRSSYSEIPHIIHQTAMSDKTKWNPIWEKCQQSWIEKFPGFEYRMWTDEDLENLIKTKYNYFYDTYMSYDVHIKRVDAARYFILYEYGGMYVDMDYECIQNFWNQINQDKVSMASTENALMISPKGDSIWLKLIDKLEGRTKMDTVNATGPLLLVEVQKENPDAIIILDEKQYKHKGGIYAVHHGTGSWIT
jgi:mannosyltransferase OCH1-like enzyme